MTDQTHLNRTLSFGQIVLYGLGTTIGAGIYALLGEITGIAGFFAPWSFLLAAILALTTAMSFARMVSRYPRAAGAALYVQKGFRSPYAGLSVGLLVIFAGIVSSAALLNGLVGYAQDFVALERIPLILIAVASIGVIACWGINVSAWVAALITIIEVFGLLWAAGLASNAALQSEFTLSAIWPSWSSLPAAAVLSGAVLAFYAYIGFEDMVEVAEEVKDVKRALPRAILLTLILSTLLYVVLVVSALMAVGPEFLAQSNAPLSDLVAKLSQTDPLFMSGIGLFAIINGALIQLIMASRVLYGLAERGQLPAKLAQLNKLTQTPILASVLCITLVLIISITGTVEQLARFTSLIILIIFTLVNLGLIFDERRQPLPNKVAQITASMGAIICFCLSTIAFIDLF